MSDNTNTFFGWTLFGGIVALGSMILIGEYFHTESPEKGGYEVADAAPEGGSGGAEAAKPTNFAAGDATKGSETFKKCASCHTITSGGANGIGPNLYAVMGKKHGATGGFAYSSGMLAKAGNWDFEGMDAWLKNPKKYVEGTKMSFAGLSKPEDRANVIAYINAQGSNLPIPAAPAEAAPAAASAAPAADAAKPAAEPAPPPAKG
ncbi:MAG: cytochrome c family protein [Pseudomonadota bacterium]